MITVIIVTKDRPIELERCLRSIQQQTRSAHVIIVDGSTTAEPIVQKFGYRYYQSDPGITKQRNVARQHIPADTDVVVYCDDDTVWSPTVLQAVHHNFQDQAIIGLTGNLTNQQPSLLKQIFGVISCTFTTKPYGITHGMFNIINPVIKPVNVQWLPGAFMCYRWGSVNNLAFDEWFNGYGLGEDFDFSYRAGQLGTLMADPAIVVEHHHSSLNRDWKTFGYMRIVNRQYLRKKFWPGQSTQWLGMWWANIWLMLANGLRGMYSRRYRDEFIGEIKGLTKLL